MTLPVISIKEMVEAGAHFGHKTRRWNPKMAPYIFGIRNDVHIIDLQQSAALLHRAMVAVRNTVLKNGRVLFVGTKRQAGDIVAEQATRCGQYYVNHRWLGGMLTNWKTVSNSIRKLKQIEDQLNAEFSGLTKNERLQLDRQREKLERSLSGIRDMGGLPDILFVIDTNRESLAVLEAQKLGIPVIALLDSNSEPDGITYPIPANDDAIRSVEYFCRKISDAVLDGIQEELIAAGVNIEAGLTNVDQIRKKKDEKGGKPARKEEVTEEPAGKTDKGVKVEKKPARKATAKKEDATEEAPAAEDVATAEEASAGTKDDDKIKKAS